MVSTIFGLYASAVGGGYILASLAKGGIRATALFADGQPGQALGVLGAALVEPAAAVVGQCAAAAEILVSEVKASYVRRLCRTGALGEMPAPLDGPGPHTAQSVGDAAVARSAREIMGVPVQPLRGKRTPAPMAKPAPA